MYLLEYGTKQKLHLVKKNENKINIIVKLTGRNKIFCYIQNLNLLFRG